MILSWKCSREICIQAFQTYPSGPLFSLESNFSSLLLLLSVPPVPGVPFDFPKYSLFFSFFLPSERDFMRARVRHTIADFPGDFILLHALSTRFLLNKIFVLLVHSRAIFVRSVICGRLLFVPPFGPPIFRCDIFSESQCFELLFFSSGSPSRPKKSWI